MDIVVDDGANNSNDFTGTMPNVEADLAQAQLDCIVMGIDNDSPL